MIKQIDEIKNASSRITASLLINDQPDVGEKIYGLMKAHSLVIKQRKELNKLMATSGKDREKFLKLLKAYQSNWKLARAITQVAEDYFLTHKRFTSKRKERLDIALGKDSNGDLKQILQKVEKAEHSLIQLGLEPVKIQRRQIKFDIKYSEYLTLRDRLEKIIDNLPEKAHYLYREM